MFNALPIISAIALSPFYLSSIKAHGYSSTPIARQLKCHEDGGYWGGKLSDIPNQACRNAYAVSGTYPFMQRNEFSANVRGYDKIENVKKVIKDGHLCSAGHDRKAGFDIASDAWYKNIIQVDNNGLFNFTVKYCATMPHNPSFWEVRLSKEEYNSSKDPLKWDDLLLISKIGDIKPENGKIPHCEANQYYEFEINNNAYPITKSNENAILYIRWQRVDPGNEGFYNCVDVSLKKDDTPTPKPSPKIMIELTDQQIIALQGQICPSYHANNDI